METESTGGGRSKSRAGTHFFFLNSSKEHLPQQQEQNTFHTVLHSRSPREQTRPTKRPKNVGTTAQIAQQRETSSVEPSLSLRDVVPTHGRDAHPLHRVQTNRSIVIGLEGDPGHTRQAEKCRGGGGNAGATEGGMTPARRKAPSMSSLPRRFTNSIAGHARVRCACPASPRLLPPP